MKKSLLFIPLAALTAFALTSFGQVTTSQFTDATALANALLAGNSGITIDSATYTGVPDASGFFTSTPGLLPFNSGIVLTSGSRSNVEGLNTETGVSTENGAAGNPSLDILSGGATFDAATLVIKFKPITNVISFQYVFASDEYNEFVNEFNDVFGFFLNGQNIALVPGTSTPVAIDNINNNVNSSYYYDNAGGSLPTQMDGLVGRNSGRFLFATGNVNPGVENTIEISIADALDRDLDSAVFLGAGTFIDQPPPAMSSVPEPATYGLFGALGLLAVALGRKRFSRQKLVVS